MRQHVLAGLGDVYAGAILFPYGLHPQARTGDLDVAAWRRLHGGARRVCRGAIVGSTAWWCPRHQERP